MCEHTVYTHNLREDYGLGQLGHQLMMVNFTILIVPGYYIIYSTKSVAVTGSVRVYHG
jgi:hypothetical protein